MWCVQKWLVLYEAGKLKCALVCALPGWQLQDALQLAVHSADVPNSTMYNSIVHMWVVSVVRYTQQGFHWLPKNCCSPNESALRLKCLVMAFEYQYTSLLLNSILPLYYIG